MKTADRLLRVWISTVGSEWRSSVFMVKAATVIAWHRKGLPSVPDLKDSPRQAGEVWRLQKGDILGQVAFIVALFGIAIAA